MAAKRKAAASAPTSAEVVGAGESASTDAVGQAPAQDVVLQPDPVEQGAPAAEQAQAVEPVPTVANVATEEGAPEDTAEQQVDGAADAADPADPVVEVEAAAPVDLAEVAFPKDVVLRNHSQFHLVEPVSGKFLPPGAAERVTLHDEAFASRVLDNVAELRRLHALADDALVIDGL